MVCRSASGDHDVEDIIGRKRCPYCIDLLFSRFLQHRLVTQCKYSLNIFLNCGRAV